MNKQRTISDEPHSLGRYGFDGMRFNDINGDTVDYEFRHVRDDRGNSVLFFDGESYWMVPLKAGVPATKVKVDVAK